MMDFFNSSGSAALARDGEKKPKQNPEEYLNFINSQKALQQKQAAQNASCEFVFADEKMMRIKKIVEQIAQTNVPVLITGESGTGKEIIAKLIHRYSRRDPDNFVAVNCAALPPNLLESELFGHEKGAFTGADQKHIGKFELANNGTLLLDEVTETDSNLQAKLLRALQENEIERVGGNGPIPINTRIIATTNRELAVAVKEGTFRKDLFYRLYVIHLEIPPLRQRPKDIEVLTRHFLRIFGKQFRNEEMVISAEAMNHLIKYSWPGNVRELQNLIQRVVIMASNNLITLSDLTIDQKPAKSDDGWIKHLPIGEKLRVVETQFILETLKSHNGNRTHSAKTLGISLRTLRNKINEFVVEGHEVPNPTLGKPL
jgi:transcriptional regulator with PAS, ATPase and Fis domain